MTRLVDRSDPRYLGPLPPLMRMIATVCEPGNDPRDAAVFGALDPDCPPEGCCACVAPFPWWPLDLTDNGNCWDCRDTSHTHGWYGSALRVRWRL